MESHHQKHCPNQMRFLFSATLFFLISYSLSAQTFCVPGASSCTNASLSNVSFGGINNASGCAADGYSDYTSTVAAGNITGGTSVPITLGIAGVGYRFATIWIDNNQNGSFETNESYYLTAGNGTAITGSIAVPTSALGGLTRMRIRLRPSAYASMPCDTYATGETEDYTVNITAFVCSGAPAAGEAVTLTSSEPCAGVPFTLFMGGNYAGYQLQWENKIEKLAQTTSNENVTSLAGVPTWTLILLKRILEIKNKQTIAEVWPNLELYINGGVSFVPYREQFEKIIGKPINYLEVYNASEGFFAAQEHPEDEGMTLYTEHGIFYEFMPVEEYGKEKPQTVGLKEVQLNKNYALVISTTGGLWRYLVGDTVQFTSLNPYQLKVSGRLKHYINTFGEEVIVDNSDHAIAQACARTGCVVNDYTAAPVYFSEGRNGCHEWLIEFDQPPSDLEQFTYELDSALKSVNSDYEAKRYNSIALSLPKVHILPKGIFASWLQSKGKIGGQHKVPRLSNDRKIIEEILALREMV
jgi:hypothetical protein